MNESAEFNHAQERRSLKHKYAEMEGEVKLISEAAYGNERKTRERVHELEEWRNRSLSGRLKWLLTGK